MPSKLIHNTPFKAQKIILLNNCCKNISQVYLLLIFSEGKKEYNIKEIPKNYQNKVNAAHASCLI